MSAKEIVFDVIVAALSVIGFYGVLHGVFESLLVPRELATAVLLEGEVSPEELDILLCEALRLLVSLSSFVIVSEKVKHGVYGQKG